MPLLLHPVSLTYTHMHLPGHYSVPDSPSAPAYTMAGRTQETEAPDSPGPGAYGLPPDPRLPSAPAYTLAPRVTVPDAGEFVHMHKHVFVANIHGRCAQKQHTQSFTSINGTAVLNHNN